MHLAGQHVSPKGIRALLCGPAPQPCDLLCWGKPSPLCLLHGSTAAPTLPNAADHTLAEHILQEAEPLAHLLLDLVGVPAGIGGH